MTLVARATACLVTVCAVLPVAARADRPAEVKKQKTTAEANAKKAGIGGISPVETDDLLVYATIPEVRAKPLAEVVQKTYELSRTTLKFGPDEKPWPGKPAVYVLTDPVQFTNYVRLVEQRRPDKGVTYTMNIRGDAPYAVYSVEPGARVTDAELAAESAALVGAALLNKKAGAGADLPEWLEFGFGRAMAVRAAGNPAKLSAHNKRLRDAVLGTKGKPTFVRAADVWGGLKTKDSASAATSLAEYLVFGPEADKFPKFLAAFKPSDTQPAPTVDSALAALEWRADVLEVAWKQWVAKQK